jgi:glyoxylase-like metal-dependent hydrolase (beta-lactamase superfamily II)
VTSELEIVLPGGLGVERVVTSGLFELDGYSCNVENNVWLVGDEAEVIVIDAAHSSAPILEAVNGRMVIAVICTHGHNDHITVAPELARQLYCPVLMHPSDDMLWQAVHPGEPYWPVSDNQRIALADTDLEVIHTPGHSPGSICLRLPEAGALFSGDTLFAGGPGATGRSHSHFPTIIGSIRDRLFALPEHTRVLTGHGDSTTLDAEASQLGYWIARGY